MRKYMSKRQRPCDFCRSRKTACRIDGAPPCRTCVLHSQTCTFVQAAQPRKKSAASSVGGSGDHGISTSPVAEMPADEMVAGQGSHPLPAIGNDGQLPLEMGFPPPGADGMAFEASSAEMQFLEDLDMDAMDYQFIFGTSQSPAVGAASPTADAAPATPAQRSLASADHNSSVLDASGSASNQIIGLSGDMDPYIVKRYNIDSRGVLPFKQLAIYAVQDNPIPVQFLFSQPSLYTHIKHEAGRPEGDRARLRSRLEDIVSQEMGARLIGLYQRFIGPQYPVFPVEFLPDPRTSAVYLLGAVYTIAFPFAIHDEKLCIDLAYNSPPYADISRLVEESLWPEMHCPGLDAVQTLLLLVNRPASNPLVSDGSYKWSLLGTLVACATNLGLHLDPATWKIPEWQICHRRRLSFLVYTTDRWLAASLGRPPQISNDNWLVQSLRDTDRLGSDVESGDWTQALLFSELTSTLDMILSKLYSLRAVHGSLQNPELAAAASSELLSELSSQNSGVTASGNAMINKIRCLGQNFCRLLIYRALMRPYLDPGNHTVGDRPMHSPESLRNEMESCLAEFSKFTKGLSTDSTQGIWPPWCQGAFSSLCYSLLTMAASASTADDALRWIHLLNSTRKDLRLKANSIPIIRLGLLRIDSLFWRGIENVLHLEPHVREAFKVAGN